MKYYSVFNGGIKYVKYDEKILIEQTLSLFIHKATKNMKE